MICLRLGLEARRAEDAAQVERLAEAAAATSGRGSSRGNSRASWSICLRIAMIDEYAERTAPRVADQLVG